VGVLETVRDLEGDVDGLVHRQPTPPEPRRQVLALHQLHRQEADAIHLLEPVHRGDARMVEGRQQLGHSAEAAHALRVSRHLGRQHLERDLPAEHRVSGAVDLAHASAPDRAQDLVLRQDPPHKLILSLHQFCRMLPRNALVARQGSRSLALTRGRSARVPLRRSASFGRPRRS
jgi:hypothetical protein